MTLNLPEYVSYAINMSLSTLQLIPNPLRLQLFLHFTEYSWYSISTQSTLNESSYASSYHFFLCSFLLQAINSLNLRFHSSDSWQMFNLLKRAKDEGGISAICTCMLHFVYEYIDSNVVGNLLTNYFAQLNENVLRIECSK